MSNQQLDKLWQQLLVELRLRVTRSTFNQHLVRSQLVADASSASHLVVQISNPYSIQWLNGRFAPVVTQSVHALTDHPFTVTFVEGGNEQLFPKRPLDQYHPQPEAPASSSFPTYGDLTMPSTSIQRVRIYSHVTQTNFFHVEDALGIRKLRLFAGRYQKGRGASDHTHHFVDLADARLLLTMLMAGRKGYAYKEYKGTLSDSGRAVSRVMSVQIKGDSAYIELKRGAGKLTATGAIAPVGQAEVAVNVAFKLAEAQRLAATVLAYIRAWDVVRMMQHQQLLGGLPPFTLAPQAEVSHNGRLTAPNPAESPSSSWPLKRQTPTQRARVHKLSPGGKTANEDGRSVAETQPEKPVGIAYGNGKKVDEENETEVATFKKYQQTHRKVPESRAVLLAFYQQHPAAPLKS